VTAETIGFIGIGIMGWPMAGHLVRAGYALSAYDSDATRRRAFAQEFGTPLPATPADLASSSMILTMLPTGPIVRQVLTEGGEASLAATLRPGSVVLDTTSSEPAGTRALGEILARRGVSLVDACVSGAQTGAVGASLVFMLGADDEAAVERVTPVLSVLGKRIFRTGPLGSGNAMKALNNFVSGAGFIAVCEAMIVGRRFGLDPAVMMDVFNASTGRNFTTEVSMHRIVNRTFDTNFQLALFTKDLKIAAEMGDSVGLPAPLTGLVHAKMTEARDAIGGDRDHTLAFTHWERLAAEKED
jgi:3-hydroxyisobutyrate dehydrogenase